MWGGFKSFASEALETAKDLKAHIKEITAEDASDSDSDRSSRLQDLSDQHLLSLQTQVRRLSEELRNAKDRYAVDIAQLSQAITDLRNQLQARDQLLKAREGEVDWITQSYQEQLQELVRAKSLLQTEVQQLAEESRLVPGLQEEVRRLTADQDRTEESIKSLSEELETERIHTAQLTAELEKERSRQEEHIDRAFFLQFLEMYNKNIGNFRIREEMLESLVSQLALSPQEQERLGIELRPAELKLPQGLQGNLFDSFRQFLIGD